MPSKLSGSKPARLNPGSGDPTPTVGTQLEQFWTLGETGTELELAEPGTGTQLSGPSVGLLKAGETGLELGLAEPGTGTQLSGPSADLLKVGAASTRALSSRSD